MNEDYWAFDQRPFTLHSEKKKQGKSLTPFYLCPENFSEAEFRNSFFGRENFKTSVR